MKKEKLIRSIGLVDDNLIEEYDDYIHSKNKALRIHWTAVAAGLCLVITIGVGAWQSGVIKYIENLTQNNKVIQDDLGGVLAGGSLRPCFRYEGGEYLFTSNSFSTTGPTELSEEWKKVATIESSVADLQDELTENLQTNYPELIGCDLWANSSQDGWIYLEMKGNYLLFVTRKYDVTWISYNGQLYLYEDSYYAFAEDGEKVYESYSNDSSYKPDDTILIGNATFEARHQLPTGKLSTNNIDISSYNIYIDPKDSKVLYIEVPNGLSPECGTTTRYDKYFLYKE